MAKKLTGIEIYKLLPRTNCGDCKFTTCMAFAMQVAAKKVALDQCPHVSAEAEAALGEAQAPPMRTVTVGTGEHVFTAGGETVLFRHEEKFHRPTGIAVKVSSSLPDQELDARVTQIERLRFQRVGQEIAVDMVAVACDRVDSGAYSAAVKRVRERTTLPLLLLCPHPEVVGAVLPAVAESRPLVWAASEENWEEMGALAREHKVPLAVRAATLGGLAGLVEQLRGKGVEDLVLDPGGGNPAETLARLI